MYTSIQYMNVLKNTYILEHLLHLLNMCNWHSDNTYDKYNILNVSNKYPVSYTHLTLPTNREV